MSNGLEQSKASLEQIAQSAKDLRTLLFPVERKIRETPIKLPPKLPKITFLDQLYAETVMVQRIAMLKASDADNTNMQGKALFPFALALYGPLRKYDFPVHYDAFYYGTFGYRADELSSLDLLIQEGNPSMRHKEPRNHQSALVLKDFTGDVNITPQLLRSLQFFYTLDTAPFVKQYKRLLSEIGNKLNGYAELDVRNFSPRFIPTSFPNLPIQIVADRDLREGFEAEEKRILSRMMSSRDWANSYDSIRNFMVEVKDPRIENLRKYRILSATGDFLPINLPPAPKKRSIIGIDDNLTRLEGLIRGYSQGKSTPNIVLLGSGGVGKTTSLSYVIGATRDLKQVRYFLLNSLEHLKTLSHLSNDYKPVGIIDDMTWEINPVIYDKLKQHLEGLQDTSFFDRALIIISANSDIWNKLPDPVKQRLGGVELHYKPDPQSYDRLVRQFCKQYEVSFKGEMVDATKDLVPRQVRDYVRAFASQQAGLTK